MTLNVVSMPVRAAVGYSRAARRLVMIAAILLAAYLGGAGINQHVLWDDEASTALFATSLLQSGTLSGWDGRNVNAFRGGNNLDANLQSRESIPLQHYVAAASIKLVGRTTWGARLPFLLVGLATIWLLGCWSKRMLPTDVPAWLPPLLLSCNVPFLLYIAQCRYYSLAMAFTVVLLWAWASLDDRRRRRAYAGGAAAALLLALSNPLNAAALVAACVVGGLHPRFRTRHHVLFVALIGAVVVAVTLHDLIAADILHTWEFRRGTVPFAIRFIVLMVLQLQGLSLFEFFPLLMLPLLLLPWVWPRLNHLRPMAGLALTVAAMMLAVLVVVGALSPQTLYSDSLADMRYVMQLLVMGPLVTSAAVAVVASLASRTGAALLLTVLVFSNLAYGMRPTLQCTLCERIHELRETHPSGTDAVLTIARTLPPGTVVMFDPDYLATSVMFYRPDLLYAGMLDPAKTIDPALRKSLPAFVFRDGPPPDVLVIGGTGGPAADTIQRQGTTYRLAEDRPISWVDRTRPELPLHQFRADPIEDRTHDIAVYRRVDGKP